MFSKKEDFTDIIQYKIGERIDDLSSNDYDNINDLAIIFKNKNDKSSWKGIHFLNTYYLIKNSIEKITESSANSDTNINKLLNKTQKLELQTILKNNGIEPIEQAHPKFITKILIFVPLITILGSMLFSTYLITAKDVTGWIYLSGLAGVILSALLIKITQKLRTQFNPNTILEYSKSTYVIRHKYLQHTSNTNEQLVNFILDEFKLFYKKEISATESIPLN